MRTLSYSLVFLLTLSLVGCQDLSVENEANPNTDKVLTSPSDVNGIAKQTFNNFWAGSMQFGQDLMFSTMSDEHAASWGNAGMRRMSNRPRKDWNNSPSFTYAYSSQEPWFDNYTAISNANDVLAAVANIGPENVNNQLSPGAAQRLNAFANFMMAMSYGHIAATFDRAFTADTSNRKNIGQLKLKQYPKVMDFAMKKFDEAIRISENSSFTITADQEWIWGTALTSSQLAMLARSMKAKYAAAVARTPSERGSLPLANVNWSDVYNLVENGMEANGYTGPFGPVDMPGPTKGFIPISDNPNTEWSAIHYYAQSDPTRAQDTWSRTDYKTMGPADTTAGYQNWLDTPPEDRLPYVLKTPDRRVMGPPSENITASKVAGPGTSFDPNPVLEYTAPGKYMGFRGTVSLSEDGTPQSAVPLKTGPYPPARGTYHYSDRGPDRFWGFRSSNQFGGAFTGPMPHTLKADMDLLQAEACLRGASACEGGVSEAVELINNTRVDVGNLSPATTDDPVGSPTDHPEPIRNDKDNHQATLWSMLKYEHKIENLTTGTGTNYFFQRGVGALPEGTLLHFPVPGQELNTLGLKSYTFGGVGGRCVIGNPNNCFGGSSGGSSGKFVGLGESNSAMSGLSDILPPFTPSTKPLRKQ